MKTVIKKHRISPKEYTYYTRKEASERGICWAETQAERRACRVGDWVLLSDGYVAPIINKWLDLITIPHTNFWVSRLVSSTEVVKRPVRGNGKQFNGNQRKFLACLLRKSDPYDKEQAWEAFLEAGYSETSYTYFCALCASDKIREKIMEHMDKVFGKASVDHSSIIKKHDALTSELLATVKAARKSEDYSKIPAIAKQFGELNAQLGKWAGFEGRAEREVEMNYGSFALPETKTREELPPAEYEVIEDGRKSLGLVSEVKDKDIEVKDDEVEDAEEETHFTGTEGK